RCGGAVGACISPASGCRLESAVGKWYVRAKRVAYVVEVCNRRIQESLGDAIKCSDQAIWATVCSLHLRLSTWRVDYERVPGKVAEALRSRGDDGTSELRSNDLTQTAIAEEEEGLVVLDGAADITAKLVAVVRQFDGRSTLSSGPGIGVEVGVAVE